MKVPYRHYPREPCGPDPSTSALLYPGVPSDVLDEIQDSPVWSPYLRDVRMFLQYLDRTAGLSLHVDGVNRYTLESESFDRAYIHRWTEIYQKRTVAKFYRLEDALKATGYDGHTAMMNLTTYQGGPASLAEIGGLTIGAAFDLLTIRRRDLLHNTRQHIAPGVPYFWMNEPHKSGYPHCHVPLFGELDDGQMARAQSLWTDKYHVGGKSAHKLRSDLTPWEREHGKGMYSIARTDGTVRSIRNYLMKYMSKSLYTGDMTAAQLVYNAVARTNRYRFWGASRDLTRSMKLDGDGDYFLWLCTAIKNDMGEILTERRNQELPSVMALPGFAS